MNSDIQTALLYFLVGMVTVFIVLCIVVLTGKILVFLINKYGPVSSKTSIKNRDFKPLHTEKLIAKTTLSKKKLAAILSAVDVVTMGKGRVINIEKINSEK